MIHKKYSKILEVKKTKMQAKVKKNSHIKTNKKSIKTQMTLTQIKKVKKMFHIRNLITIPNHFKTIILKKILHKIINHKQEIYKKLQELRKDMKKTLGKKNNGDKAILRKIKWSNQIDIKRDSQKVKIKERKFNKIIKLN